MTYIPDALRREVVTRAGGRCEYCHVPEEDTFFTHEIDHIYAEKHDGPTVAENLCVACIDCNRHKGSDLCSIDPETGDIVPLFHPRHDRWDRHVRLVSDGSIEPLSATGRVTVKVLRINRPDLVAERARLVALGRFSDDRGYENAP